MSFVPQVRYTKEDVPVTGGPNQCANQWYSGLLVSMNHRRTYNGSWDGGGPFLCLKRSVVHSKGLTRDRVRQNGAVVFYTNAGSAGTPQFVIPSTSKAAVAGYIQSATDYGLVGYNRTKPGQSSADLLVSAKELLSDGLPSIPLSTMLKRVPMRSIPMHLDRDIRAFKNLGSEYLNIVFGWKPFIKDLRALYKTMKTIDAQVNRLIAQNGHAIRRRAVLKSTSESVEEVKVFTSTYVNIYGGGNPWPSGKTRWSRTTTDEEEIWYSARYRYWIPKPLSWQWQAKARAVLFGAYPTPGNLYAAMPWSWLVDWFASIGEVLNAIGPTAVDNLVQLYGFTMRKTTHKVVCSSWTAHAGFDNYNPSIGFGYTYAGHDLSTQSVYTDVVKSRSGGFSPFGPDKVAAGFTPYQLSILSALSLTRLG
jgi:hypothetical protein